MTSNDSNDATARGSSTRLLAAALAGLVAANALGCKDDSDSPNSAERPDDDAGAMPRDNAEDSGPGQSTSKPQVTEDAAGHSNDAGADPEPEPETYNRVLEEGLDMTLDEFRALCDEHDGWAYVTAFCSGSGMCKGLFLLGGTLSEHSCKGMNGCGGAGCVLMPEDSGMTGKEVYESQGCENCHGNWSEDYSEVDLSTYTLIYPPWMTAEEKLTQWEESSRDRLISIMVFGTQGLHENGIYYSNMPEYRSKLSLAEIERTVDYLRTLPTLTAGYEIFGVTPGYGTHGDESESDAGAQGHDPAASDAGPTHEVLTDAAVESDPAPSADASASQSSTDAGDGGR